MNYDVIVVGAGPAGLVCGRRCTELGLKTLIIDRKQEIGAPVRCGEALAINWINISGIKPDMSWCLQKIDGAVLYTPSGKSFDIPTNTYGYIIERKIFEKKLAEEAINKGCKIILKSDVIDVIKEKDQVVGVKVETSEKVLEMRAKIIIAADGVDSRVARFAGINTVIPLHEIDSGYQYQMAGLHINRQSKIHLYFGNEIASRGYVWLFPKSESTANVGIGVKGDCEKTAKYYLDKFIEQHSEIFKDSSIIEINAGGVPVCKFIEKPYGPGIILIGDAARMVNPLHGGGIGPAIESALIAAEHAHKAISENNLHDLRHYFDEWYQKRGKEHEQILKVRKFFELLSDNDIEELSNIATKDLILDLASGKKIKAFAELICKKPNLAVIALKSLLA